MAPRPRFFSLMLVVIATIMAAAANASSLRSLAGAIAVPLGECVQFAVMAGTSAAFNGELTTVFSGDIGVSPGTSVTGNFKQNDGTVEINSTKSNQCASDRIVAFNAAAAEACPPSNHINELGGLTLFPGVYCAVSSPMTFSAGTLTLDGQGDPNAVWVFQASSSLLTSTSTSFVLENGASERNIFWQASSSASLGDSSSFAGTIIAYASVSVGTNTVLTGRALAGAGASFAGTDSVTLPSTTPTI